jgi:hypothetical protein
MEKPIVYVETTIPSYLVSEASADVIVAGHQLTTHYWWRSASDRFELVVSDLVFREATAGHQDVARQRLAIIEGLPILGSSNAVDRLVQIYDEQLGLTGRAKGDLPHFAFAVAYECDFLVTWNCAHLANAIVVRKLQEINHRLNLWLPVICTPEELMSSPEDSNK